MHIEILCNEGHLDYSIDHLINCNSMMKRAAATAKEKYEWSDLIEKSQTYVLCNEWIVNGWVNPETWMKIIESNKNVCY